MPAKRKNKEKSASTIRLILQMLLPICRLTYDVESKSETHLGLRVHLALIDARITFLWKFDL